MAHRRFHRPSARAVLGAVLRYLVDGCTAVGMGFAGTPYVPVVLRYRERDPARGPQPSDPGDWLPPAWLPPAGLPYGLAEFERSAIGRLAGRADGNLN